MIYHVIANALVPTKKEYCTDYFTQTCIKFCDMMTKRGHQVYFYGVEKENVDINATKYITVLPLDEYKTINLMTNNYTNPYLLCYNVDKGLDSYKYYHTRKFTMALLLKLENNYKKGDIVVHTLRDGGYEYNKNMIHMTLSHGGGFVAGENIVFMTDSWRDIVLDKKNMNKLCEVKNHCVIYPWYTKDEVAFNPKITRDTNTFLYLARCQIIKGFGNFLGCAKTFPKYKFIVAGGCKNYDKNMGLLDTGEENGIVNLNNYPNVTYLGKIGIKKKKELLQTVTALIQPTLYVEPGGSNVMEASLCGCPVIAPNKGGFTNTVINGRTGVLYEIGELWEKLIDSVKKINPEDCHRFATSFLSEDIAYGKYMAYFDSLVK